MKRIILTIFLLHFSLFNYSKGPEFIQYFQRQPKILIGLNENEVRNYFNELISSTGNRNYLIEREYDNEGEMNLSVTFSRTDEVRTKCLWIVCTFNESICYMQGTFFSNQSADQNVGLLKNSLNKYSENTWRKYLSISQDTYIEGKFIKQNSSYPNDTYTIIYTLIKN
jgi:hypothetical protein